MSRWRSASAAGAAALLLVACGRDLPARVDAEPHRDLSIGVPYAAVVWCAVNFPVGDGWWGFEAEANQDWPADISIPPWPFSLWAPISIPYAVPGTVTLASPTEAVFRADVDGRELPLRAVDGPSGACL